MASASSSSQLFYGLFLASSTLFLACDAQHKLGGLQVIDEILHRRNKASNITIIGDKSSLLEIPSEIWEDIRRMLILSALDEAERETFEEYRCDKVVGSGVTCDATNALNRGSLASLGKCHECYYNISTFLKRDDLERDAEIGKLLSQFGLQTTSYPPIQVLQEAGYIHTFDRNENEIMELTCHAVTLHSMRPQQVYNPSVNIRPDGRNSSKSEEQATSFPAQIFIDNYNNRVSIQKRFDALFEAYQIRAFVFGTTAAGSNLTRANDEFKLARWIMRSSLCVESTS